MTLIPNMSLADFSLTSPATPLPDAYKGLITCTNPSEAISWCNTKIQELAITLIKHNHAYQIALIAVVIGLIIAEITHYKSHQRHINRIKEQDEAIIKLGANVYKQQEQAKADQETIKKLKSDMDEMYR